MAQKKIWMKWYGLPKTFKWLNTPKSNERLETPNLNEIERRKEK
jgi:hypothetical protein